MPRNNPPRRITGTVIPSLRRISSLLLLLFMCTHAQNTTAQEIIFHNEASDTTRLTNILIDECSRPDRGNAARLARLFIDTPYIGGTLEGDSIETLRVNIDEFDCTTFVETVAALAITAGERRQSWHDFAYNLRRLRYRNGETNGYASRLHYISDWILNNSSRGTVKELTGNYNSTRHEVKTLDFMTSHRESYPALADSANFAAIRNIESGFSNHRYPILKPSALKNKQFVESLRDGDIVFFCTATKGLDVTHAAIIDMSDGTPRLIHASSKSGKVILDTLTLSEYVNRNRSAGIRIVRIVTD